MKKYKSDIIFFGTLAALIAASYFIAEVLLPFIIGIALAFIINPFVKRIQRFLPNRNLAVSLFLVLTVFVIGGTVWLFASQINNDFVRLNSTFKTFAESNGEMLNETTQKVKSYIEKVYSPDDLKEFFGKESKVDSLEIGDVFGENSDILNSIDTDEIKKSLSTITSFFTKDEADHTKDEGLNWFIIFLSSIGYFLYIIYTFPYFESKINRYTENKYSGKIKRVLTDVKKTFVLYLRNRSKVVIVCTVIYIVSFFLVGVPGALILGVIAGVLCYIPYLQYLVLIPLSLGCLILSIEHSFGFFFYFGIVLSVFIITSVLEELVLFPKFMKDVSGMNPAVMMVSVSLWGYLLGMFGVLIALPLTSLVLSYISQILLYTEDDN